jgi:hypothetical protein
MDKKLIHDCLKNLFFKHAFAGLFMVFFLGTALKSYCQSYFYFENSLPSSKDTSITYYTFLILQNNGTATARIRYIDPLSGEKNLVEINLRDSADVRGGLENPDHYLIMEGDPLPKEGTNVAGFHLPKFKFKRQTEQLESFYVPESVMFNLPDGTWTKAGMLVNEQKSLAQLRREEDFVTVFYNEMDEFYTYLFGMRTSPRDPQKRKEKLYLITVVNTLDSSIGETTRRDLINITNMFTQLARDINMDIVIQKIADNVLTRQSVETALARLRPAPIDIVIFYYSGHGYRRGNDASNYPRMSLRINGQGDLEKNSLSLEAVYKTLAQKKAKVTLVIGDCCNENIDAPIPSGPSLMQTKAPGGELKPVLNASLFRQLFFPVNQVSILVGSADKNQLAVCNPNLGGYYTSSFTAELRKTLYGIPTIATWLTILASTKKNASWLSLSAPCGQGRCVQSARFSVLP